MPRILGVDIPSDKPTHISLRYLYGIGPARVSQRVANLVQTGRLYFDLDLAMNSLGFNRHAQFFLTCAPSALDRIGRALAGADEVPFVGMTSGATNLSVSGVFRDDSHLYEFVGGTLGRLDGIVSMELMPVTRSVKFARSFQSGAMLSPIPPVIRR